MAAKLHLNVIENGQVVHAVDVEGTVELGRQRIGEPDPFTLLPGNPPRLLVAYQHEVSVSRQHLLLEATDAGTVRITNLARVPVAQESGEPQLIAPKTTAELTPPFTLVLTGRSIRVDRVGAANDLGLHSFNSMTIGPVGGRPLIAAPPPASFDTPSVDPLVGWLQTTLGVLQSAIGSVNFLDRAAEAMVSIVGLHFGLALLFEGDGYTTVAAFPLGEDTAGPPSRRVLEQVRREKRTFWQEPEPAALAEAKSLFSVQIVVAAPLLNPEGEVIGALYGERRRDRGGFPRPVSKLEALLVELLACGVATGLARQQHERAALSAQVRFEQFFTPELARHLAREPNLLEGREAEVTLLFCDIRGFSRFTEILGPEATLRWVSGVMDELSRQVLDEGGVLVDYIGDEMMAMWGAPQAQPDHAERALRAALRIRAALPAMNAQWRGTLGEDFALGIGLNTGLARVGNTGSRHKFKYGPLGNSVNLASRVQGLTKYLKCGVLATAATRERLGPGFISRRVCRARVVNISEPVDLYEIDAAGDVGRAALFRASEAALEALEAGDFDRAVLAAGTVLQTLPAGDGPLRLTLARAAQMLVNEEAVFDPVWVPPGK